MRIRKFLHSCLLIEKDGGRILFDPGKFSFIEGGPKPSDLTRLDAVIVTHSHPDHMDEAAIGEIMRNNPQARLMGNGGIASALRAHGLAVELFEEGIRHIAGFKIDAYEARHAPIVAAQIPPNTAYIVDDLLLNPGDSYAYSLDSLRGRFKMLALPVMAPWTNELQTIGFAARMGATSILPIHDGYAKDFFLRMRYDNYEQHFSAKGVKFERPESSGASVDL